MSRGRDPLKEERASASRAPLYLEGAVETESISYELLQELMPERHKMEQAPYEWRPWAAYALEWGEARVGLGSVAVGMAPRVEVGSQVPLNALGVYNGRIKVDALRVGPVDLAAVGSIHTLPRQDFGGQWLQAGGLMSVRVADPVTMHLGARWGRIRAEGLPELGRAGTFLTAGQEAELDQWIAEAQAQDLAFAVQSTAVTTRFAIDWRFNRRDSLVLGPARLHGRAARSTGFGRGRGDGPGRGDRDPDRFPRQSFFQLGWIPETPGRADHEFLRDDAGLQASYKNATLRVGVGVSAIPYAWLLQSTELAFHFGGKTRTGERRMRRGWRQNRRELRQGGESAG